MGKFNYSLVLVSVIVASPLAAAQAADLGLPPEPMPVPAPIPVGVCCDMGGFYLKGFVGMTNQEADGFTNDIIESANFTILDQGFDSSPLVGIGFGYQLDRHFRFDVTGEYRGDSNFRGIDYAVDFGYNNEHTGIKSEWLTLANAYWDIATFRGITPFVGAGIGTAAVSLDNFWDVNQNNNALYFAEGNTEWNFAWALHAGLAYEVSDSLTVDVAYRYVNMGDGVTGHYQAYNNPGVAVLGPTTIEDIESHDVMVGLRWRWDDGCCAAPAYVETSYPTTYK